MSKAKRTGTDFEVRVRDFLKTYWPKAERLAQSGTLDKGDITGVPAVVECKAVRRFDLAGWMDETERERLRAGEEFGILIVKRPYKHVRKAYALLPLEQMAELLSRAQQHTD